MEYYMNTCVGIAALGVLVMLGSAWNLVAGILTNNEKIKGRTINIALTALAICATAVFGLFVGLIVYQVTL